MAVTIGSVTEGNANAEEIKNNSPDSELYEKNKKYLQGSLVKFNDKIYLAKRNVPSDVDLDNPYYWEIFMDAADSKRVDELFEKTGNLDELETESKDNLVNAINEAVLYTAQSLTEEEQAQARANIGAQDLYNGLTPVSYSCTDGTYSVSDTVYLESGNIISPIDTVSNDVRLAFRYINLWGIPTQSDDWKNDIQKYKLLIDNGYLENNTIWYSKPDKKFKKQIRFATSSTLGNYIVFNFNYDYEVIGQLVYFVDTDTISTGTDTYLNYNLKRDKNNVLSYSAIKLSSDPTEPMQIATKQYVDNAIANTPPTDLSNCVQTNKENILGDNGSIISNSSRGNSLIISNGVIEQKNSNQDTVSLGNAKVVFSHDIDGSSSTRGNGTFTMYGRKGEEYFKFNGTNGDVRVSGIATPTLSNDAVNKGYVDSQIANIEIPTVPTNVGAFANDAGYLTAVPSEYVTETELNAKGYLTEHQSLADYALKSEIPSPYSLPTASATELGGVKADPATADDTQPVRIGNDGKLVTAAGKTDIPEALPNPNALTFTGAVNATYDGSMAVSVEIPSGGGTDISLGLTSAAVGQIIKVKAVDESGKPTAWEAADMPSGGGGGGTSEEFILLAEVTLEEAVRKVTLHLSSPTKHFITRMWCPKTSATSDPLYLNIGINGSSSNLLYYLSGHVPSKDNNTQCTVEAHSLNDGNWAISAYSNLGVSEGSLSNYNQSAMIPIGVKNNRIMQAESVAFDVVTNDTTQYFPVGSILSVWGV